VGDELDALAVLRLTAVAAACLPFAVQAHHPASQPLPGWDRWSLEPWVLALLAASALLYAVGLRRLWRRAGRGRGVTPAQAYRFATGWMVLAIALVSPVDAVGGALFSAHMVQHELLMVVAAPLLVCARPLEAWTWALAPRWRRLLGGFFHTRAWSGAWRVAVDPLGAWLIHAVVLWAWHIPSLFESALTHEGVHALQHASFLASALLFWWSVLAQPARAGAGLASLFTTMLHTGGLGALLTFAPTPWYPHYADTLAYGLTPLEDQQLGGLVMWVPGGFAYFAFGLAIVARWLQPAPRAAAFR
jgi:putative membrane protein